MWGLGGEDAEHHQQKEKIRERAFYLQTINCITILTYVSCSAEKLTEKMRKVNRQMAAEGWSEGPNKWMMDMVGRTGASDAFLDDLKKDGKKKIEPM